jgi:DNA repair exonuclease SbcCD ATPase subunit
MTPQFKCPVCGKSLTEGEYDKALGLWKDKQEHIKHLEEEQKKLREKEKAVKKTLQAERHKLRQKEVQFKSQVQQQAKEFRAEQTKLRRETRQMLSNQSKKATRQLKEQRAQMERTFQQRVKSEIKKGVDQGVAEQKKQFKKQEADLRKTKSKMNQLESSLKVSARKYEQANEEIMKLKEQIEKGITPQIEGLLEEGKLLADCRSYSLRTGSSTPARAVTSSNT